MTTARKPPPTLSIIVPVHNHARSIGPILQALRPFSDRNAEIVVVDGGSSDDTPMLARPLADQVIRSPLGLARQMNEGAKVANGFIFLFLHPDTVLPLDADTQVMYGRSRDTSVWGHFDIRIAGRHMLLPLVARYLNWRSRVTGLATSDQAIFVQRETFYRIGGFKPIPVMADVELCQRLKAISPPICVTSRVTVPGHRYDRDGLWKTLRTMAMMRWRYRMGAKPEDLARRYGRDTSPASGRDETSPRSFPRKRESSAEGTGSPPSRGRAEKI